jgi:hypothetical protein
MTAFNRRSFLDKVAGFSALTVLSTLTQPAWSRNFQQAIKRVELTSPKDLVNDEDFWYTIQQAYTGSASLINLNNGAVLLLHQR